MPIVGAATPGHGITVLGGDGERAAIERWQRYLSEGGDVYKFVPASGAASRMFKALFEFVNGDTDEAPESTPVGQLMANLDELPLSKISVRPFCVSTEVRSMSLLPPDAHATSSPP